MGFGEEMINMSASVLHLPALQPRTSGLMSLSLSINTGEMGTKMQTVGLLVRLNKKTDINYLA